MFYLLLVCTSKYILNFEQLKKFSLFLSSFWFRITECYNLITFPYLFIGEEIQNEKITEIFVNINTLDVK